MIYCGSIKPPCDRCAKYPADHRNLLGCEKDAPNPIYTLPDGEKIFRCPSKLIAPEVQNFLMVYSWCKIFGFLPEPGGILDQCHTFMFASSVVEATVAKEQEAKQHGG